MKTRCLAIVVTILLPTAIGMAQAPSNYRLIWADEFDQDGPPDKSKWSFEKGFLRNSELQWYQPENAWCEGGNLVIEARRETKAVDRSQLRGEFRKRWRADYTSASLKTRGKFAWQYGRMEVRAKIVAKDGLWPAIWTLGAEGRWPEKGEVDLMEFYDGQILANAAWRGSNPRVVWDATRTPIGDLGADWDRDFHTWRMDWDERGIELSVDGRLLNRIDSDEANGSATPHPFRQPHYILLNLAVGGTHGGDPSKTEFPSRYLVDYVRVYEPAP